LTESAAAELHEGSGQLQAGTARGSPQLRLKTCFVGLRDGHEEQHCMPDTTT